MTDGRTRPRPREWLGRKCLSGGRWRSYWLNRPLPGRLHHDLCSLCERRLIEKRLLEGTKGRFLNHFLSGSPAAAAIPNNHPGRSVAVPSRVSRRVHCSETQSRRDGIRRTLTRISRIDSESLHRFKSVQLRTLSGLARATCCRINASQRVECGAASLKERLM